MKQPADAPLRLVATFPFSIYPIESGGALRGYYLLRELARFFDTDALVIDAADQIESSIRSELGSELAGLRVHNIPPAPPSRGLFAKISNRLKTYSYFRCPGVASNSTMLGTAQALQQIVRDRQPEVAILTNLESWVCGAMLGRVSPGTIRIMDMHNVEHALRAQKIAAENIDPDQDKEYCRLKREAEILYQCADGLFACSDEDRDTLSQMNRGRIHCKTIPNGVACEQVAFDANTEKHRSNDVLFCGTLSYPPNIDGLNWFAHEIWPLVVSRNPQLKLRVVGRGFDANNFPNLATDPSVEVVGEAADLGPHYRQAGIAICPLRMGSGTRLKILESMSFGNPTVSTAKGCEGIGAGEGDTILIRDDPQSFADAVVRLADDADLFDSLRNRARRFVEQQFDWRVIGKAIQTTIDDWASGVSHSPANQRCTAASEPVS